MSVPPLAFRPGRAAWLVAFLALACSPEPTAYQLEEPSLNKGGGKGGGSTGGGGGGDKSEVVVSSVFPTTGSQGETLYMVKVSGSNFESGAKVAWERNGVVDPLVRVLATRFKNKTEIEVDIAIDEAAVVTNYDVSVTLKSGKRGVGIESFEVKEGDPTATWLIPDDGGLSLRSDGQYSTNGLSTYTNGVCGITAKIFATTDASNSGDATIGMDVPKPKNGCSRRVTLVYPDQVIETIRTFGNLRELQNTATIIPVGATETRVLAINPKTLLNNPSRCDRLLFGVGIHGAGGGSDRVNVTRVDRRTWRIWSDPGSTKLAWCEKLDTLFEMTVDFTIVASEDLPE